MATTPHVDDEYEIRQLDARDAEAGFQLSSAAGWNQTVADWQMMLEAGQGFGAFSDGQLVGSALYLPYPPAIAWVSMVLVDDAFRRRGIGSMLTTRCVQRIEKRGLCAVLDATDAGQAVYSRMGFHEGPSISRFAVADAGRLQHRLEQSNGIPNVSQHSASGRTESLQSFSCTRLDTCYALDVAALGGNRNQILRHIAIRGDDVCVVVSDDEGPAGFGMLRRGRAATQVGPIIVRPDLVNLPAFDSVAATILAELAGRTDGPVIVDVPDRHPAIHTLLKASGFEAQRRFIRMYRGALPTTHPAVSLAKTVAIGGPAIG